MTALAQSLIPDHLADQPAIDVAAEAAKLDAKKPAIDLNDPKAKPEYVFTFKFENARGQIWEGTFTSKIITIADKARSGLLQAQLNRSLPPDLLDSLTREINYLIAYLQYTLPVDRRPEWAKDLSMLYDVRILQRLYREVYSHEVTFLGLDPDQG